MWLARHEALGTEVAVKMVSPDLVGREGGVVARMRKEASLAAQLASPHVVKPLEHGELDDGRPYLVMELLRGETLGAFLAREERMPSPNVLTLAEQVAEVLDEAHGLGIVHRDIKPDNVFLVEGEGPLFAKVLDFGIAKETRVGRVSDVTTPGSIVGTPEYMSPEQLLSSKTAGPACDRWALAVLAYRALVGRLPFTGETLPSLSLAICHADYDPPSEVAGLPTGLDAWFARAFAVEPEARFPDARSMVMALRASLEGTEHTDASPPRPAPTAPRTNESLLGAGSPSPTISGSASDPTTRDESRGWSRTQLGVATLALAAGLALAANLAWHRALPVPRATESMALPPDVEPWSERTPPRAAALEPSRPSPSPSTAPAAVPTPATSAPNRPTPAPSAAAGREGRSSSTSTAAATMGKTIEPAGPPAPSATVRPGCENPFELDREGDLVPKPGCM